MKRACPVQRGGSGRTIVRTASRAGRACVDPAEFAEALMSDPVEPLILDLLEWIGCAPRPYAEVIEAWRTSCPRLPVWEEANARGFLEHRHPAGSEAVVVVSDAGLCRLEERAAARRRANAAAPAREAQGAAG
jgi:hypothetical protein